MAPSSPLFGVPSSSTQQRVDARPGRTRRGRSSAGRDRVGDVGDRAEDALAAEARLVAVAQLDRFVGAGRGAGRHRRAPDRAVGEDDVDLDRRIAARVEDLARVDEVDEGVHALAFAFALTGAGPIGSTVDARQLAALEELERRAAAGRDVGHPVGQALLGDRRDRVAATDDDRRAGSARSASSRATAFVPCANDGISNTPSGPFQNTVWTSASASTIRSWLALPRSTMCHDAGIFSAWSVLYSVPRVTSLATMTSTGRTTRTPFFSAAVARIRRGVLDAVGLGQALADRLALGEQERVGHAAAEDEHVDLGQQVVDDLDLVGDLGPAEDRRERPLGRLEELREHLDLALHEQAGVGRQQLGDRRPSRRGRDAPSRTRR